MAQFDVFKNPGGGAYTLLVDIQADVLGQLPTRVVVPLTTLKRYGGRPITRLNPVVTIGSTQYVMVFQDLAAVPVTALGDRVDSLAPQRDELVAAIDLLFTGI